MINSPLVKARLAKMGLNQTDVARIWGVAQPTANQKLNRVRPISLDEAEKLADLLKIRPDEFANYFFAQ
ncbi:MAG: helix-turn-helix transcriptional regulator [Oscillospiraceae bacterium]|jgi:plasmid maintenance system antidote protein VapI|nr:helix-turn-helix transcriptional regulator [Oscillospiraceae bacterium]